MEKHIATAKKMIYQKFGQGSSLGRFEVNHTQETKDHVFISITFYDPNTFPFNYVAIGFKINRGINWKLFSETGHTVFEPYKAS